MRPQAPTVVLASPAVGERIRQARKARGLSQAQLADQIHVGRRTVQAWELGESGISGLNLVALATVLGVSSVELVQIAGAPTTPANDLARIEAKLDALLAALGVGTVDDLERVRAYAREVFKEDRAA